MGTGMITIKLRNIEKMDKVLPQEMEADCQSW